MAVSKVRNKEMTVIAPLSSPAMHTLPQTQPGFAANKPTDIINTPEEKEKKHPGLAALSFFIPGAGQLVRRGDGDVKKGLAFLSACIAANAGAILVKNPIAKAVSGVVALATGVIAAVDAYKPTKNKNDNPEKALSLQV